MYYHRVGELPEKRHTQFRRPDGSLYNEEMQGQGGFSSNYSFLYHREVPTAITSAKTVVLDDEHLVPNSPLLPRHLRTQDIPDKGNAVEDRVTIAGNAQLRIRHAAATETSPLYRNAAGDELLFVIAGAATLESSYGDLELGAGDYVVVPTSTTHRFVVTSSPFKILIVESNGGGHVKIPSTYLSSMGQLLDGAPYTERDIRMPEELPTSGDGPVDVLVRTRDGYTRYTYAHDPFDVVGWDGYNYPWALNIRDYMPSTGALHKPPSEYLTFEGPGFVVCSLVPRLFDYHPDAVKVPYNHANVDSDELLFYWEGDFFSRHGSGIGSGSISLHPAGFVHGPQPGSAEASLSAVRTEEYAFLIDTFSPVQLGSNALAIEDEEYPWSWARLDAMRTTAGASGIKPQRTE